MIFIDPRKGSGELAPRFASCKAEHELAELEAADFAFAGYGPDEMVTIGVERKEIGDMLNSLRSHRLSAFQAPKILDYYDAGYVLVEGAFRPDPRGPHLQLLRGKGRAEALATRSGVWETPSWLRSKIGYDELMGYLNSIEQSGLSVLRSYGPMETVRMVLVLERWWSKRWSDHNVFQQFRTSSPPGLADLRALDPANEKISLAERRRTLVRLMSKEIPGVGWVRSRAVAERFPSVREMARAGPSAWLELEGIGPKIALRAAQLLGGTGSDTEFNGD